MIIISDRQVNRRYVDLSHFSLMSVSQTWHWVQNNCVLCSPAFAASGEVTAPSRRLIRACNRPAVEIQYSLMVNKSGISAPCQIWTRARLAPEMILFLQIKVVRSGFRGCALNPVNLELWSACRLPHSGKRIWGFFCH